MWQFFSCKWLKLWREGMGMSFTVYNMVRNFHWCEISRKCVQTLQKTFLQFLFSQNKCVTLWTTSSIVAILYSSRLIIIYSDHLEGRHTVENHLIHMGTSSYWCMQYWRHNSIFRGFYFCWSRSVRENLHLAKMSHCMVFCKYNIFISILFFSS